MFKTSPNGDLGSLLPRVTRTPIDFSRREIHIECQHCRFLTSIFSQKWGCLIKIIELNVLLRVQGTTCECFLIDFNYIWCENLDIKIRFSRRRVSMEVRVTLVIVTQGTIAESPLGLVTGGVAHGVLSVSLKKGKLWRSLNSYLSHSVSKTYQTPEPSSPAIAIPKFVWQKLK